MQNKLTAVIPAAGMSRRLKSLTENTHKSLLEVNGKPLLLRILKSLKASGISNVVIVTGFCSDKIKSSVAEWNLGIEVDFVHNPDYQTTNNMYSLFLARPFLENSGMLLLDSDILFDERIISLLLESGESNVIALRESPNLSEEEIKVIIDSSGNVKEINKTVNPSEAIGESIGIELFDIEATNALFEIMDHHINSLNQLNDYYEVAFEKSILKGLQIKPLAVGDLLCMEMDTPEDFEIANELAKKIDKT